jgi:hypothetical protein
MGMPNASVLPEPRGRRREDVDGEGVRQDELLHRERCDDAAGSSARTTRALS